MAFGARCCKRCLSFPICSTSRVSYMRASTPFTYLAACPSLTSIDITWQEHRITPTVVESRLLCSIGGLRVMHIGGVPSGHWARCPVNRAEQMAPLPFTCRHLTYLICQYSSQPQVLSAFYRSMRDAVLVGRASASNPLFPSLRVLVAVQSDSAEEEEEEEEEEGRRRDCAAVLSGVCRPH